MVNTLLVVLAALLLVLVLIIEMALSVNWNRIYFTFGLPIFIRWVPVSAFRLTPLDTDLLASEFPASLTSNHLEFKKLDDQTYAFRASLFESGGNQNLRLSIMHGILILDQTQREVTVKGFVNWVVIVMLPVLVALWAFSQSGLGIWWGILLVVVVVLIGVWYSFEANRYGAVARRAAELAAAPAR
jgi:hypothetical protein